MSFLHFLTLGRAFSKATPGGDAGPGLGWGVQADVGTDDLVHGGYWWENGEGPSGIKKCSQGTEYRARSFTHSASIY